MIAAMQTRTPRPGGNKPRIPRDGSAPTRPSNSGPTIPIDQRKRPMVSTSLSPIANDKLRGLIAAGHFATVSAALEAAIHMLHGSIVGPAKEK